MPDDLVYITKAQRDKLEADLAAMKAAIQANLARVEDGHDIAEYPELANDLKGLQGLVDELEKMLAGAMPFPEAN